MRLTSHVIQATATSAVMTQFLTPIENVALFLSIIFIDVDHYFDFVVVCKRFGVRDMFKYHGWVWHFRDNVYGISLFHTAEAFILLFALGFASHYFWIILAGFLFHFIFDLIFLTRHRIIFNRAFSIIEYVIRKRNPASKGYPVPDDGFWNGGR
ncbi:MAG: hypothetical protein HY886_03915 [Deltaproteobacteria bacterium]|nr:hypothetical protein [Deltaproteobacteria bacterium]